MTTYRITNASNVYFPGFSLDLDTLYESREDAEDAISEAVTAYNAKVGSGGPDLDIVESSKDAVSEWHTVTTYGSTYDTEDGTGACDVEVQVGEDGGLFYLRTTDDAGGSDEADDTAYPTHAAARKAGLALAKEQDECDDIGADAWLAKQASEADVEDVTVDVDAALDELDAEEQEAGDDALIAGYEVEVAENLTPNEAWDQYIGSQSVSEWRGLCIDRGEEPDDQDAIVAYLEAAFPRETTPESREVIASKLAAHVQAH